MSSIRRWILDTRSTSSPVGNWPNICLTVTWSPGCPSTFIDWKWHVILFLFALCSCLCLCFRSLWSWKFGLSCDLFSYTSATFRHQCICTPVPITHMSPCMLSHHRVILHISCDLFRYASCSTMLFIIIPGVHTSYLIIIWVFSPGLRLLKQMLTAGFFSFFSF